MTTPALLLDVRFRSRLPFEEVMKKVHERAADFAALDGLVEKYYVQNPETGEIGAIYLWDSQESLEAYRASDLRKTLAQAYQVEGELRAEVCRVVKVLRASHGA